MRNRLCLLRTRISRSWTRYLLIGFVVISSVMVSGSPAFAAACNPGSPIDASGGSASCDMNVSVEIGTGNLTLANDTSAAVPGSPFTPSGVSTSATFNFNSLVKDHRGSTAGWSLQAASVGIPYDAGSHMLLSLTSATFSCGVGQVCPAPTFTPITLSSTSTTFLAAGNGTTVIDGDYTNTINGTFTIPPGIAIGSYTGTVTMTLLNVF
jgi:hypothetical protein